MHYPFNAEVRETERVSNIFLPQNHEEPLVGKRAACFKINSEGGSEALQPSWHQPPAENQETDPTGEEHESKGALHPFQSPGFFVRG